MFVKFIGCQTIQLEGSSPRHIIIKLSKSKNFDKERILERIKFVTYKGTPRRLLSYFSAEEIKRTGSKRWEGKKKKANQECSIQQNNLSSFLVRQFWWLSSPSDFGYIGKVLSLLHF